MAVDFVRIDRAIATDDVDPGEWKTEAENSLSLNALSVEPTPSTNPLLATTSGNDVILGTELGEKIFGLAGNDAIAGFGGNDALNGGPGDDTLNGNAGSDMVFGSNTSTDANVPDAMKQSVLIGGVTTPVLLFTQR